MSFHQYRENAPSCFCFRISHGLISHQGSSGPFRVEFRTTMRYSDSNTTLQPAKNDYLHRIASTLLLLYSQQHNLVRLSSPRSPEVTSNNLTWSNWLIVLESVPVDSSPAISRLLVSRSFITKQLNEVLFLISHKTLHVTWRNTPWTSRPLWSILYGRGH